MLRTRALPALALLVLGAAAPLAAQQPDQARWRQRAQNVTITRDDWGIAHVRGKTDADAVFGMVYAQAEDDFNRVETNYINALGRLAEAEGEPAIWQDLRMKLFVRPGPTCSAQYAASPAWLRALMDAWADGLNYYLATHPQVTPRVITPVRAVDGALVHRGQHRRRHRADLAGRSWRRSTAGTRWRRARRPLRVPGARARTASPSRRRTPADGHALLLINPHTSFFFRSELQMTSDEGLNAYGAATWGQFFIYQGFNDHAGLDAHLQRRRRGRRVRRDDRAQRGGRRFYRYGAEERPVATDDGRRALPRRGRVDGERAASRSTAPTTARSCARRTASGSRSR